MARSGHCRCNSRGDGDSVDLTELDVEEHHVHVPTDHTESIQCRLPRRCAADELKPFGDLDDRGGSSEKRHLVVDGEDADHLLADICPLWLRQSVGHLRLIVPSPRS